MSVADALDVWLSYVNELIETGIFREAEGQMIFLWKTALRLGLPVRVQRIINVYASMRSLSTADRDRLPLLLRVVAVPFEGGAEV